MRATISSQRVRKTASLVVGRTHWRRTVSASRRKAIGSA